ncbi:MAG: lysophospholipid acyltransferase family protein, partial [Actinobacteria bacterium]|nr:lysophospholipid acyltransferase family protein [Actinomycetota bacterium]
GRLCFYTRISLAVVKKNICIALNIKTDDPETGRIALKIYINWFKNIVDFLKHKNISSKRLKERVGLIGKENLDRALKKGRGVVIFTCHIGNFEWGACRLAVEGYDIWGVSLVRKSGLTNKFFESNRLAKGLKTLYTNRMLNVFRILKNNGIVAIPSDWDPTGRAGRPCKFFGKNAFLPTGAVQIAIKSGAALLPSFIWRKDKYNHRQVVGEPLELDLTGDNDEQLNKNIARMHSVMEKYIVEHITEWELFHDIWQ